VTKTAHYQQSAALASWLKDSSEFVDDYKQPIQSICLPPPICSFRSSLWAIRALLMPTAQHQRVASASLLASTSVPVSDECDDTKEKGPEKSKKTNVRFLLLLMTKLIGIR
jgi:hypothetical protein